MMQQYFAAKRRHPGEILFFRMGDFYEMFFDDAREASEILGIALTSRSKEKDAIPMAGVPVRAADSYLARLLRAGKRVAICDQVQDPREAKGLVDRDVVRVISPGTITDEKIIGEKSNNYIAAVVMASGGYGLAWLDVSTGRFLLWETPRLAALEAEISRLSPAEVVLPESLEFQLEKEPALKDAIRDACHSPYSDPLFDLDEAYRTLTEHFGTQNLEGFGCERLPRGIRAAGGLLRYLQETQKVALKHITRVQAFQESRILPIDRTTQRALELTETSRSGGREGTLLASFDRTCTSAGGRLLRDWLLSPLTDVDAIVHRQEGVEELTSRSDLRDALGRLLRRVHDLERICARVSYSSANARDLLALARTLELVPDLRAHLEGCSASILRGAAARLADLPGLRDELAGALLPEPPLSIRDGGLIREGYCAELDELRAIAREGKQWIARFQQGEIEKTGISSLKVGFNKVFGYYLEVTNTHREKIPPSYIRKQTLKNCERFITPELKEYENKVLHAREQAVELEHEIFLRLRDEASGHIEALQETAAALAEVDVIRTFSALAQERGYVRPRLTTDLCLKIVDGRHPMVEEVATTEPFVPNSVELTPEANIMIITGPNMAGKSTYIRQVALLVLLAQTGSSIPARSAEIGIIDRLFTRVGASDDLTRGQSTFMVEMQETANILNNATERSLIILDEVGRGTSTFDGVSLAWAITEHVAEKVRARTLFATHYHELTALSCAFPCVRNFNIAVKEWNDDIIFLRKIAEGGTDKSYGIHVARLAGIPREVIDRSKEILSNLENQSLDIHDQPSIARRAAAADAADRPLAVQLDFFHNANDGLLKELKRLDLDRMTPMEALRYLDELRRRIV
ncbi:MAG: DNA mismatch repair protein MutS [Planctomycetes bacterium]|nr:DNA mismatch repair protein MutS [Planctomycetota bacterium]